MKRPNITPGPWTTAPAMRNQDCGFRIHTPASAPYGMAHIYSPGADAEENAKAIAAVPDLLAALEALVRESGRSMDDLDSDVSSHRPLIAAYEALTKAGYEFS